MYKWGRYLIFWTLEKEKKREKRNMEVSKIFNFGNLKKQGRSTSSGSVTGDNI